MKTFFDWLFEIFKYESTALFLALLMIFSAVAFFLFIALAARNYCLKLKNISKALNDLVSKEDVLERRRAFVEKYESIRLKFLESPFKHNWLEFEETIIKDNKDRVLKNTSRPQNFFHLSDLKYSPSHWSFIPNVFVGFGLLFTFIGLAAAIGVASGAMGEGVSSDQMQIKLGEVLEIASVKFITSITGLGLSIILSLLIRACSWPIASKIEEICQNLEKCMKASTSQDIQEEQLSELKEQSRALNNFSDNFAVNLGDEIEKRLGIVLTSSFGKAMQPLYNSLQSQLGSADQRGAETVGKMLEQVSSSIDNGLKESMNATVEALGEMKSAMSEVIDKVSNSGDGFGKSMEAAAMKMQSLLEDNFESSAKAINTSITSSAAELKESLSDAGNSFTNVLMKASENINDAAVDLSSNISKFVRGIDTFDSQIMANIEGFEKGARNIQETVSALDDTAQNIRTASEPIAKVASEFSKSSENIINASKQIFETYNSIQDINSKIAEYSETVSNSWKEYRDRFENVDSSLERIFEAFDVNVSNVISKIGNFTTQLDSSFNIAGGELNKAVGALKATVEELEDKREG